MAADSGSGQSAGAETKSQEVSAEEAAADPVPAKNTQNTCQSCERELVTIRMTVDGSDLVMESCQSCDERRWHLAGEQIDLQQALDQVGEHAGRRR